MYVCIEYNKAIRIVHRRQHFESYPIVPTTDTCQHNYLNTMCLLQLLFSKLFNSETFFAPPNTKSTINSFQSAELCWTVTTMSCGSMLCTASAGFAVSLELHHVRIRSPHNRRQPFEDFMRSVLNRCCDVNVQSKSQITRSCAESFPRSTPLSARIFYVCMCVRAYIVMLN